MKMALIIYVGCWKYNDHSIVIVIFPPNKSWESVAKGIGLGEALPFHSITLEITISMVNNREAITVFHPKIVTLKVSSL